MRRLWSWTVHVPPFASPQGPHSWLEIHVHPEHPFGQTSRSEEAREALRQRRRWRHSAWLKYPGYPDCPILKTSDHIVSAMWKIISKNCSRTVAKIIDELLWVCARDLIKIFISYWTNKRSLFSACSKTRYIDSYYAARRSGIICLWVV